MDAPITDRNKIEEAYFDAYEDLSVHELMLLDRPRVEAYQRYLAENEELIRGKVVLDVGAGTGILSMLAARHGASKVFAVEASQVAQVARLLVSQNKLGGKVAVVQSTVEEADLGEKVDVIISEWMGFYLVHEGMLGAVIHARDKWLKPGGLMLPATGALHLAPVAVPPSELPGAKAVAWDNYYGFDFSGFAALLAMRAQPPLVRVTPPAELLAPAQVVSEFDFRTVTAAELSVIFARLTYRSTREVHVSGFCCWFDVRFVPTVAGREPVILSTSPFSPPTHWKQTTFLLPTPTALVPGKCLNCNISFLQDEKNPRLYNVNIETDEEEGTGDVEIEEADPEDCECAKCKLLRLLTAKADSDAQAAQVSGILFK